MICLFSTLGYRERILGSDSEDSEDDIGVTQTDFIGGRSEVRTMRSARSLHSTRSMRSTVLGSNCDLDSDDGMDGTDEQEDYRIAARPKATRANDMMQSMKVPSNLEELLNDQFPSSSFAPAAIADSVTKKGLVKNSAGNTTIVGGKGKSSTEHSVAARSQKSTSRGRGNSSTATSVEEDDDDYEVVISTEGTVVVVPRVKDDAVLGAEKLAGTGGEDVPKWSASAKNARENDGHAQQQEVNKKRRLKEPGEEYRSKKAGGDIWKRYENFI